MRSSGLTRECRLSYRAGSAFSGSSALAGAGRIEQLGTIVRRLVTPNLDGAHFGRAEIEVHGWDAVLALGASFSALEVVPLAYIGFEAYHNYRLGGATRWMRRYRWPVMFFIAVAFWNLVGAGLFGFLINPPLSLYYMHGLGHGIGLEVHEPPWIVEGNDVELVPGMVFSVEPGVYLPGWGGVRIEDDYVITEKGAQNLCSLPKKLDWASR